jgi:hypothetical protein
MLFAAVQWLLMAQSGQANRARVCPLLTQTGPRRVLSQNQKFMVT